MGSAEGISRLPGASYGVSFLDTVLPRNPVTGARQLKILPESYEIRLGAPMYEAFVEDEGGEVDPTEGIAKERVDRVNSVFDKLKLHAKRKEFPYEVKVIHNDEINAWCLPGGKVGICWGLLERISEVVEQINKEGNYKYTHPDFPTDSVFYNGLTEDDLIAAVLAHEITHADARHAARKLEWSAIFQGVVTIANFIIASILNARKELLENEIRELSSPRVIPAGQQIDRHAEAQERARSQLRKQKESQKSWTETLQTIQKVAYQLLMKFGKKLYDLAGSRSHEHEADIYGSYLAEDAGFQGYRASLCIMDVLRNGAPDKSQAGFLEKAYKLLGTHPFFEDRQAKLFDRPTREHLQIH